MERVLNGQNRGKCAMGDICEQVNIISKGSYHIGGKKVTIETSFMRSPSAKQAKWRAERHRRGLREFPRQIPRSVIRRRICHEAIAPPKKANQFRRFARLMHRASRGARDRHPVKIALQAVM